MSCLIVASGAAARRRLSRVIARQRPPAEAWLSEPEGFSLPSKHTTLAALAAGECVRALGARGAAAWAAPVLAGAAVGASRVYLGVHWLSVDPARVAFVLEALGPGSTLRTVDLVFLATADGRGQPGPWEADTEAQFVPLGQLAGLDVRPPLAGYLRALHARGGEPTAACLGNLWRPPSRDGLRLRGQDAVPRP
jgi:PAP2 superfamily